MMSGYREISLNLQQLAAEVKAGDVLGGKYRVERVIGSGGMGIVVEAIHLGLNDRVALKFLRSPLGADEETFARFRREAMTTAKIKSPHVARVTDVGTLESGCPYTVMELLEGQSLDAILKARGAFEIEFGVDCLLQACEGLATAHAAGAVHRDIKPSNLFLTRAPDDSPLLKLLDFGISKSPLLDTLGDLTASERSMGTPLYMSPEQMRSAKNVDLRADIWSLGVVAYEVLTGKLPFIADNLPVLCSLVLDEAVQPVAPRSVRPELPEAVSDAILRCLEKDPEKRFRTVAELAQALAPYAGELGVLKAGRIQRISSRSSIPAPAAEAARAQPISDRSSSVALPVLPEARTAISGSTATAFGHTRPAAPRRYGSRVIVFGGAAAVALAASIYGARFLSISRDAASTAVASTLVPIQAAPSQSPTLPLIAPVVSASAEPRTTAVASAAPAPTIAVTSSAAVQRTDGAAALKRQPSVQPRSRRMPAVSPSSASAPSDDDVLELRR